jgi:hypothetical protein
VGSSLRQYPVPGHRPEPLPREQGGYNLPEPFPFFDRRIVLVTIDGATLLDAVGMQSAVAIHLYGAGARQAGGEASLSDRARVDVPLELSAASADETAAFPPAIAAIPGSATEGATHGSISIGGSSGKIPRTDSSGQ